MTQESKQLGLNNLQGMKSEGLLNVNSHSNTFCKFSLVCDKEMSTSCSNSTQHSIFILSLGFEPHFIGVSDDCGCVTAKEADIHAHAESDNFSLVDERGYLCHFL